MPVFLPTSLNPFENQVYFHVTLAAAEWDVLGQVLIPLRIRSISTFYTVKLDGKSYQLS